MGSPCGGKIGAFPPRSPRCASSPSNPPPSCSALPLPMRRAWSSARERAGQTHSERALPLVEEVLAARGWSLADLDAIAFGAGPGCVHRRADRLRDRAGPRARRRQAGRRRRHAGGAGRGGLCAPRRDARRWPASTPACTRSTWRPSSATEGAGGKRLAPAVLPPAQVAFPAGRWFGAGDGFAVAPSLAASTQLDAVDSDARPERACRRRSLQRGRGEAAVVAEQALPLYVRHRVALTTAERASGAKL